MTAALSDVPLEALRRQLQAVDEGRRRCAEVAHRLDGPAGLGETDQLAQAVTSLQRDLAALGPALARALAGGGLVIRLQDGRWDVSPVTTPMASSPTDELPAVAPTCPGEPAPPSPASEPAKTAATTVEPSPRASAASLEQLARKGLGGGNPVAPRRVTLDARVFVASLPRPAEIATAASLLERLRAIETVVARRAEFGQLDGDSKVALLTFLAASLRHLQERAATLHPTVAERIVPRFRELSGWVKSERPGFVHGLASEHAPKTGTWLGDARASWDALHGVAGDAAGDALAALGAVLEEGDRDAVHRAVAAALGACASVESYARLVRMLAPHEAVLKGVGRFKTLRKDLREQLAREDEEEEALDRDSPVPADWPCRAFTVGKRVLAVGGDRHGETATRWREAFGFEHVAWETGHHVRRVQATVEAVLARRYDLVVLLRRFVSHSASDPLMAACKQVGIPFVVVDAGYGVAQVRRALEDRVCPAR